MTEVIEAPSEPTAGFRVLAEMAAGMLPVANETKRRMWAARDEVARLRTLLAAAEADLSAAEREHADCRDLMMNMLGQLRAEHEALHTD